MDNREPSNRFEYSDPVECQIRDGDAIYTREELESNNSYPQCRYCPIIVMLIILCLLMSYTRQFLSYAPIALKIRKNDEKLQHTRDVTSLIGSMI